MKVEIELHVPIVTTVTEHLSNGALASYVVTMRKLLFEDGMMLDIELDIDHVLGLVRIRKCE